MTDLVFPKSRSNWFSTCTVYPLPCSQRPLFPSPWGALLPWAALFSPWRLCPGEEGGHDASWDWWLCGSRSWTRLKTPSSLLSGGVVVFFTVQGEGLSQGAEPRSTQAASPLAGSILCGSTAGLRSSYQETPRKHLAGLSHLESWLGSSPPTLPLQGLLGAAGSCWE